LSVGKVAETDTAKRYLIADGSLIYLRNYTNWTKCQSVWDDICFV